MSKHNVFVLIIIFLLLALGLAPVIAQEPAAEDGILATALLGGPCTVGTTYDPACDVNHDGTITVEDIELTASRWGTSGTWTSGSWDLTGNPGTDPSTNFLGTTDAISLTLAVNGTPTLRLEPGLHSPNLIGGHSGNSVTRGVFGATIGGGGSSGDVNRVTDVYGTVGGGRGNQASQYATVGGGFLNAAGGASATVAGGSSNTASGNEATVGGGYGNTASGDLDPTVGGGEGNTASGDYATVSGGRSNTASDDYATVSGGYNNTAGPLAATVGGGNSNTAGGWYATVGGGWNNTASGDTATIPGGIDNEANGHSSFAAGRRAKASHDGAFVWGDSTDADIASTGEDQFVVRATGGLRLNGGGHGVDDTDEGDVRIGNDAYRLKIGVSLGGGGAGTVRFRAQGGTNRMEFWSPGGMNVYSNEDKTTGVRLSPGAGSWSSVSDRNQKRNFVAVDSRQVLDRLAQVPITTWNYKSQDTASRHMGPTAQDFYAAFGLGDSDTHISTVDADGVALAAIQGLYQMVQEKDTQIVTLQQQVAELQQQNASLEARLAALEQAVGAGDRGK